MKKTKGGGVMLFRKKIERACAYCARAVKADEDTMVCRKKGPVSANESCRRFRYDPLKRIPEAPSAELPPQPKDADYSL